MASEVLPPIVDDEKDAILGLLQVGFQRDIVKEEPERPEKKIKLELEEGTYEDETTVGSPVLTSRAAEGEDDDAFPSDPRPQPISPIPDHSTTASATGSTPREVIKKRKHHASVEGQYEDAEESNVFNPQLKVNKDESDHRQPSGEPHAVPPPPHLIQQTSNEYTPPPPALQAQTSAELARQALAYQQQRSLMENGMFPSHFAAMMAAGPMTGTMGETFLEREHRLQMEILAMQAHMHMSRQAGAAAAAAAGATTPSQGKLGSLLAGAAATGYGVGSNQLPLATLQAMDRRYDALRKSGAAFVTPPAAEAMGEPMATNTKPSPSKESSVTEGADAAEAAVADHEYEYAMKPPTRVESEDDYGDESDDDASKTQKSGSKTVSTKERYEKYKPPTSWGEITQVRKMPYVNADYKFEHPIAELGENDVMLGRGGLSNQNTGNIRFRKLVRNYRIHYCTAPKGDKGALARYLCNYVRAMGGRFLQLRKDKNGGESTGAWYEVGDEKAVSKCGQALREGTAEFARKRKQSTLDSLGSEK